MNYGVLVRPRQPTDYVAGTSPITFEVINPTGDWRAWEPQGENQNSSLVDSMACVSFSMVHAIESQIKFLTGQTVELSERFVAKMSNTTTQGNYQTVVADAIRKYGIPLASDWPIPPNFTWDEFYAEIPQDVKDKALDFLRVWDFSYEFVNINDVAKQLQQAPLQVVIEQTNPYHAQELLTVNTVFDTYKPYEKPLGTVYDYLKPLIKRKHMAQIKQQNKGGELRIVLSASSIEEWNALCKVYGLDPAHLDETLN